MNTGASVRRVLVIKLGALGDFVQATGAFADIRAHEAGAETTLLTTPAMLPLARGAPFFDRIEIDRRLPGWRLDDLVRLTRRLRARRFDMVYDLQAQARTARYWRLMGRPPWSGVARGCSHPHTNPRRNAMCAFDIFRDQLRGIGVPSRHAPSLAWAGAALTDAVEAKLGSPKGRRVALLPGSAPTRPEKRWPGFADLAQRLVDRGDTPVLIGAGGERGLLAGIAAATGAINLCDQLSLNQLVTLFGRVDLVVGNDTGPMHIAAAAGAPGLTIVGPASDAERHAPRGPSMEALIAPDLAMLDADEVLRRADALAARTMADGRETVEISPLPQGERNVPSTTAPSVRRRRPT